MTSWSGYEPSRLNFVTLEDVIACHAVVYRCSEAQSRHLLTRPDRLEGALARPQHAAYYEGASLARLAAILLSSVAEAQAFVEGNKRAAAEATAAFLRFNGWRFALEDPILLAWITVGASTGADLDTLTDILEECIEPEDGE